MIAERFAAVRERVQRAGGEGVRIVAVTKGFGADAIREVLDAGCTDLGESYAQETVAKLPGCDLTGATLHFIGQLQTNKVRSLVPWVQCWDSVDRPSLVHELARRAPGARVLVQVNTTGEGAKAGVAPDELPALLELGRDEGLVVEGLMTIGPTGGGAEAARPAFRLLRRLVDEHGLTECSMGMSGDLDVALAEGSTQVRVGTAIFGDRPRREPHVG